MENFDFTDAVDASLIIMKPANSNINYKKVMEIKFAAMAAVKASMGAYKIQPK